MNGIIPQRNEKLIGRVTHYFNKIGVAIVEITEGELRIGDTIHIKGGNRDFEQKVESMQIEHEQVDVAKQGESIGLKVIQPVKEHDEVFKVLE